MIDKKVVNETKFWVVSTIMLALACFVLFALNISPRITGNVVSGTTAADNVVSVAGAQFDSVEVLSVNEKSGLYEIELLLDGEKYPVYVTKDGAYLVNGLVEITEPEPQENLEIDNEAIAAFVDCLAEKEFVIYGANWCGYTKTLVDSFGGFNSVEPIYVECTENEELCASEGVTGYPTVKINGELYQGERTFEAFAEATGCSAPTEVSVSSDDATAAGGCGA